MTPREIAKGLTKAQRREIVYLAMSESGRTFYGDHFRPGWRLYDLGLVERLNPRWRANWFTITDIGRAVAAALREGER